MKKLSYILFFLSNFVFSQQGYNMTINGFDFVKEINGFSIFNNYYEKDFDTNEILKERNGLKWKIVVSYYSTKTNLNSNVKNYGDGFIKVFYGDNYPIVHEFNYAKETESNTITFYRFNKGVVAYLIRENGKLYFSFPYNSVRRFYVYFKESNQ